MRYAHCRFCDDIRFEQGNKVSLMGIYGGELYLSPPPTPEFPTAIPKLCIATYMDTGADEPLSSLSITISSGDVVIQHAELPASDLVALQENARKGGAPEDPVDVISIAANIVLAPFIVEGPKTVEVTVTADGVTYRAGKLRVLIAPPQAVPAIT